MKKVFTMALMVASVSAMAQMAKVSSAGIFYKQGQFDEAWRNIQEASQDPSSAQEPKTWDYKFRILNAIVTSQDIKYRSLMNTDEALRMMKESYAKVKELDVKKKFIKDLDETILSQSQLMYGQAFEMYNAAVNMEALKDSLTALASYDAVAVEKKYQRTAMWALAGKCVKGPKEKLNDCMKQGMTQAYGGAIQMFLMSANSKEMMGIADSNAIMNAAVCAERAKLPVVAIEIYKEAIKQKIGGSKVYLYAAKALQELKKEDERINIIKEGRVAFPNDIDLLIDELNIYLGKSDFAAAEKLLTEAVAKSPNNANMFYALGTTYDNLANPRDAAGKDLPKPANFNELTGKAAQAYEKAIALEPNNFDALYNYGALLFNQGVEYNNKANDLDYRTKKKEIDELNKKADVKFRESLIPFEKAETVKGDDFSLLQSLKQVYVRLEMTEKYNAIKVKLDKHK